MALIVYGGAVSPFVRKVRVVLAEKCVAYSLEQVSPFKPPPDFREISPLGRIPVLRDTDQPEPNTLPDSSVICDYLERKFPTLPLYPTDPMSRARAHCGTRNMRTRSWRRPSGRDCSSSASSRR
jgi:glutathione S-transferase